MTDRWIVRCTVFCCSSRETSYALVAQGARWRGGLLPVRFDAQLRRLPGTDRGWSLLRVRTPEFAPVARLVAHCVTRIAAGYHTVAASPMRRLSARYPWLSERQG